MPIFTKESLEALRQRINLLEVLSGHLEFKHSGASYKALCPFHDEKTPSFMVQKGDSHYHCFGCGAHGDAIHFLMSHVKMNFLEAVEHLAERFHVPLAMVETQEAKGPNKATLKQALDFASRFYHFILLHTQEGHEALHYLYRRGLDLDFIKQFEVGLAPKMPGLFRSIMHAKGFYDEVLENAGLLASSERGVRDFFSDRITFPVHNATGNIIGFSARKYKEETYGGKYINTAETVLFKKSHVLFGLNFSRKRIAKERKAIIVEGQIDALRLIQAGYNYTVAGQGTAFGEGHVRELLNLGVQNVFLALDADPAGQEATKKIGHLFQKEGIEVYVIEIPSGKDPDAFLRDFGSEAFQGLIDSKIDYLTFLVRHEQKSLNISSPAGKNELVSRIVQQVLSWSQPLMVHESLRKLAYLTNVPEEVVGVGRQPTPNLYLKRAASLTDIQTVDADRILESDLLRWLLIMGDTNPEFIQLARKNVQLTDLRSALCQKLYQAYLDCKGQDKPCDILELATIMDDPEGQLLLSELLQKKVNKDRAEVQFKESLQRILDRNWVEKAEDIRMKIQSGQCSDEEASILAKQFADLKKMKPKLIQTNPKIGF